MKTFKYFLFAFITAVLGIGCSDDPTYSPGEGEDPNSYGVYFPSQANVADVELDPADPTVLEFKAMRKNTNDAIVVPVEVTASEQGLFTVSEIKFEAGQPETTFTVSFDGAEIGTTYKCSLLVSDKRFAHVYGEYSSGINFSVTRVEWVLVKGPNGETKGKWRDEFLTYIMEGNITQTGQPNAEKDVEIYERADMPGYYRIKDIYDETYIRKIVGTMYSNFQLLPNTYTIIDATNKEKVWLPAQSAGYILNNYFGDSDGDMMYVSYCKENFPDKADATRYGTNDNGVITFPNKAIMYTAGSIDWHAGYMYTSSTAITRILLPGAQERDYTVTFANAPSADGKVLITATLGSDAAKVKYAYFEGELSTSLIASKAADIKSGLIETEEITASGTITAEMEKTGIYTLVGVTYDNTGASQKHGAVTFGYIKAGEERPVMLTVRAELTWEREAEGFTPENSVKGIVWGENIKSAKYGLIKTSVIDGMTQAQLENLIKTGGNPVSAEYLAKVNGNGWAPFFTGQEKGTSYTLMVWADNGYNGKLFMAEQTTQGDPSPLDVIYTFDDALAYVPKADLFNTTWNYYAIDVGEGMTSREFYGEVTFSEDEADGVDGDGEPADYINVTGLSGLTGDPSFKGKPMTAYWSDPGLVYPKAKCDMGKYLNYFVTDFFLWEENPTGLHAIDFALAGVYVADGIIAFVPNDQYVGMGYTFTGMYFGAFHDAGLTQQAGYLNKYKHLLLVDPEVDPNAQAAASVTREFSGLKAPENFVELRGNALLRAIRNDSVIRPKFRTATHEGTVTTQSVMPVVSTYSNVRSAGDGTFQRKTARKYFE